MDWLLIAVMFLSQGLAETVTIPVESETLCEQAAVRIKTADAKQRGFEDVNSVLENPQYPIMTSCVRVRHALKLEYAAVDLGPMDIKEAEQSVTEQTPSKTEVEPVIVPEEPKKMESVPSDTFTPLPVKPFVPGITTPNLTSGYQAVKGFQTGQGTAIPL